MQIEKIQNDPGALIQCFESTVLIGKLYFWKIAVALYWDDEKNIFICHLLCGNCCINPQQSITKSSLTTDNKWWFLHWVEIIVLYMTHSEILS